MTSRCLLSLFLASVAGPLWAERLRVESVRVWAAPDNTRVVFDTNRPPRYSVLTLDNPHRVVLDLRDTHHVDPKVAITPKDKYLLRIRTAVRNDDDLRVVLDLKQLPRVKVFQLQPNEHYGYRLVVDLLAREERAPASAAPRATAKRDEGAARDVVVAIDAGHGGDDPGATGKRGTREKDVALRISKKLSARIDAQAGLRAVQIREGDYFMALRSRMKRAREMEADLFISVHADAFRDPRVKGASVYVLSERGASSEAAKWRAERENAADLIGGVSLRDKSPSLQSTLLDLSQTASLESSINAAKRVLRGLAKLDKVHKNTVQSAGFLVLKSPDIPSILIETGFISNPDEEKKLVNDDYQDRLVRVIVASLHGYFQDFAPLGSRYARQNLQSRRKHVIRQGDTLSGIAERYNVSPARLRSHNGMQNDLIRVGQVLAIPRSGTGT